MQVTFAKIRVLQKIVLNYDQEVKKQTLSVFPRFW